MVLLAAEGFMSRIRHTTSELEQRAKELRQEATPAEQVLWNALQSRRLDGHKFRRQHPVGRFILDFYCAKSRLCVEVDGEVHEQQRDRDMARDATLFYYGIVTLRFTNEQVFQELPAVLDAIRAAATRPRW
jgi:very-short-patch-repair endonuclease